MFDRLVCLILALGIFSGERVGAQEKAASGGLRDRQAAAEGAGGLRKAETTIRKEVTPKGAKAAEVTEAGATEGGPVAQVSDETKPADAAPVPKVVPDKGPLPKTVPENPPAPAPGAPPAAPAPGAKEGEMEAARPKVVSKREIIAQLQIFLDQKLFSPGMIDGKEGRFLWAALMRWQRANGLPETGVLDDKVPLDTVYPVYIFHTVDQNEFKLLGEVPKQPSEQSKKKKLPYQNYVEYLAERYHSSIEFLQRLNPTMKLGSLKPGDQVRVPNVEPFKIEDIPAQGNFPDKPEFAKRRIVINRKQTILELYEEDKLVASVPIAPGSPKHPTPPGKWRILGVSSQPTFRWDKGVLEHGTRTDNFYNLPPGPNNPVGVGWIGLNKPGIGIHGTNNPYSIGQWASHGCMRTANWDIARIAKMVTKNVTVEIQ